MRPTPGWPESGIRLCIRLPEAAEYTSSSPGWPEGAVYASGFRYMIFPSLMVARTSISKISSVPAI